MNIKRDKVQLIIPINNTQSAKAQEVVKYTGDQSYRITLKIKTPKELANKTWSYDGAPMAMGFQHNKVTFGAAGSEKEIVYETRGFPKGESQITMTFSGDTGLPNLEVVELKSIPVIIEVKLKPGIKLEDSVIKVNHPKLNVDMTFKHIRDD